MLVEERGCALPLLQKCVASSQLLWRHGLERWVWPALLVTLFVMDYTIATYVISMELAMLGNENSLQFPYYIYSKRSRRLLYERSRSI